MDQKALYLYCFTRSGSVTIDALMGIDDRHQVFMGDYGGITAVISRVMLEEFVGEAAEERMKDAAWITPRAIRHQEVVAEISRQADLFPARFGTIFSADNILADVAETHHGKICDFLDSVKGHSEWSIKGFLDRNKAAAGLSRAALSTEAERLNRLSPGARYFEEKKIQAASQKQLNQWLNEKLNRVVSDLDGVFARHCYRQLLSRKATGAEVDMVLNGAFLVADDCLERLRNKTRQINQTHDEDGLTFDLSGPWPPYSFCPPLTDSGERGDHASAQ